MSNTIIVASLRAWSYHLQVSCKNYRKVAIPIPLGAFSIPLKGRSYAHWSKKLLHTLTDLTEEGKLIKFSTLTTKKDIPQKDFLLYARLSTFINRQTVSNLNITEQLWSFWSANPSKRRAYPSSITPSKLKSLLSNLPHSTNGEKN